MTRLVALAVTALSRTLSKVMLRFDGFVLCVYLALGERTFSRMASCGRHMRRATTARRRSHDDRRTGN